METEQDASDQFSQEREQEPSAFSFFLNQTDFQNNQLSLLSQKNTTPVVPTDDSNSVAELNPQLRGSLSLY